ncbi:MAG: pilin [Parcubacteria group bacterium]
MKISKAFILLAAFIVMVEFASLGFFALAPTVNAQTLTPAEQMKKAFDENKNLDVRNQLRVPFPQWENLGEPTWEECSDSTQDNPKLCMRIPWIAKYIGNLYKYGIVIGSILAVMMIMIGGVIYMTGGANPAMITRGKEYIVGAVTGIILLLGSYVLLNTINPDLINLKTIDVEVVKEQLQVPDDCQFIFDINQSTNDDDPTVRKFKGKLSVLNYPLSVKTCGDQFDVQISTAAAGNFKIDKDTKCMGTRCTEANKGCTNQLSGKYECVPAYMLGTIEEYVNSGLAEAMKQANPNTSQSVITRGSTAYVTMLELREALTDNEIGESTFKDSDLKYMVLSNTNKSPQVDKYYYPFIEVNDVSQTIASDDKYKVNKDGNAVAIETVGNKVTCCDARCVSNAPGKFQVYADENCQKLFTKKDFDNSVVRLNIDTNKFYCGKETLFDSTILNVDGSVDARYATTPFRGDFCFNAVKRKNSGEDCSTASECKSSLCYLGKCS